MIDRVSGRDAFRRLRADGVRARSGPLTVVVGLLGESEQPAVAFALPRTVGTAVVRNRLRRQLRAAARDLEQQELLPPATYLVIVRPPARGAPMTTLRGHLLRAVQHATASSATQQAR